MDLFPKHFPARLHTTKEIINFLNNYNKIDLNIVDANYIYGDLLHSTVINDSITYCNNMNHIFDSVKTVFIEITSRKYIINNGIIYNNYYYNYYNKKNDKTTNIIDNKELFSDLLHIKYLLRNLFDITSIVVIPHIDLLLDNGKKIAARNNLKSSLERICKSLEIEFVLETVNILIKKHGISLSAETLVHSDQGCHYTSYSFIQILKDKNLRQSMSRRGNCWDNAPQESFFGHMKDEIDISKCKKFEEVKEIIDDGIWYYNNERYQWNLAKLSPIEYYNYYTTGEYPIKFGKSKNRKIPSS